MGSGARERPGNDSAELFWKELAGEAGPRPEDGVFTRVKPPDRSALAPLEKTAAYKER